MDTQSFAVAEESRPVAMTRSSDTTGETRLTAAGADAPRDPDWISETLPEIQAVHRYWKSKCAGRTMPRRADLDPLDLIAYLPSLILVDVLPEAVGGARYVYRLVGTREVKLRGLDPTGKPVASHSFCRASDAFANYDQVVASRAPWIDRAEMLSVDATMLDRDKLFLPLSTNGHDVDMILVYSVQERAV